MDVKAVIFDMDGVIIDSEGLWRQAQKAALAGWRAEVSDEECESLTKGKRLDEIARTWCVCRCWACSTTWCSPAVWG